jgi:hypothetical protein
MSSPIFGDVIVARKLSFTACHRGDFVTFDAERRDVLGARACS